ncbi:MAG: hypothetical protein ACREI8_05405 [Myxococcota bacterium]
MASLFLVECFWPGVTREQVEAANARAREAALHRAGSSLRFIGSLLVPGDEVVLFQFTGASQEEVVRTSREAKLPFDRVSESLWLGPRE